MQKRRTRAWVLLGLAGIPGVQAADRITWGELSERLTPKHEIRLVLPDGARIQAHPLKVADDTFDVYVTRSSDRQRHPKGQASLSRRDLSVIEVRSPRSLGRWIGVLAPLGIGIALMATAPGQGDAFYPVLAAGAVVAGAGTPGGYFAGRAIDRRFREYILVSENPPGLQPRAPGREP